MLELGEDGREAKKLLVRWTELPGTVRAYWTILSVFITITIV